MFYSNSTPRLRQGISKSHPLKVNGRIVAVLRGDILDVRRTSKGVLNKPPAIALSERTLDEARGLGCREIVVTLTDSGTVFRASLQHFERFAFCIHRPGWDKQKALPLDRWNVEGGNPPGNVPLRLDPTETTAPVYSDPDESHTLPEALQGDLFSWVAERSEAGAK